MTSTPLWWPRRCCAARKVVYVDYVDYDEIAHHAGMFRRESLAALEGLDRVLGQLERLTEQAARRYRIVVVSDHGQSQGRPFADRYGEELSAVCAGLMTGDVRGYEQSVEGWGRADSLVEDIGREGLSGRLAAPADRRVGRAMGDRADGATDGADDVVVLGSGNLGLVYVPGGPRLTLDELSRRWPRLLPGLCAHPGVGFVAVVDDDGVPWALGGAGRCNLTTGAVTGTDPLRDFGAHARRVLTRAVLMPEAPDVYVNSLVDLDTLDVAAFEELVGAHGGLGGWQDSAVLLAPARPRRLRARPRGGRRPAAPGAGGVPAAVGPAHGVSDSRRRDVTTSPRAGAGSPGSREPQRPRRPRTRRAGARTSRSSTS